MKMILEVKDLRIDIKIGTKTLHAVRGIDFDIAKGDSLGIVGESGSGKSVSMKAIMGLSAENVEVNGQIFFHGRDLTHIRDKEWEKIRGNRIAIVSQNPSSNLNPIIKIGKQMYDVIKARELAVKKNAFKYLKDESKSLDMNLIKATGEEVIDKLESLDMAETKKTALLKEILAQKSIYYSKINKSIVKQRALNLLTQVGIDNPEMRYNQYPFELSGGMKQRVVIAIALSGNPDIVIFDEPTTALDVTIQNEILMLIKDLQKRLGFAIIFITHNLAVISKIVKRVIVMYAGKVLEEGSVAQVISNPIHPYTIALFKAVPTLNRKQKLYSIPGSAPSLFEVEDMDQFAYRNEQPLEIDFMKEPPLFEVEDGHKVRSWLAHEYAPKINKKEESFEQREQKNGSEEKILEIKNLTKQFSSRFGVSTAVNDLSLDVRKGEILCVVGESGSGKTTLARIITGLEAQNKGDIYLEGELFSTVEKNKWKFDYSRRRSIQMIFQDTSSALNPRMTIKEIIEEGLLIEKALTKEEINERVLEVLGKVDLPESILDRYPYMLSGGQRQRVQIARCIITNPSILIADEPVSDLDVSIQANIINLFDKLRIENNLTIILIAHDLSVVQYIADRVAVLYCGRLVEYGSADNIFKNPQHAYTQTLLNSVPDFDYTKELVKVEKPNYSVLVSGTYQEISDGHTVFTSDK